METETPMEEPLDDVAVRVLGSLIEKELTTPDNYSLARGIHRGDARVMRYRQAIGERLHLHRPELAALWPDHRRWTPWRRARAEEKLRARRRVTVSKSWSGRSARCATR